MITQNILLSAAFGVLQEPPPIGFTFETTGWIVLLTLFLIFFLLAIYLILKKHIKSRYRRDALKEISSLQERYNSDDPLLYFHTGMLVKSIAIKQFTNRDITSLRERDWISFLEKSAQLKPVFTPEEITQIDLFPYSKTEKDSALKSNLLAFYIEWIKKHKTKSNV